nr:ISAs1 family transposase [Bacteroides caecimuris]
MCAVICGSESWNEIERFGICKFDFFKRRFPDLVKIPSHDTFNRFFSLLKPGYFELVFRDWVSELCGKYEGVVAIDGKMLRGASKCSKVILNWSFVIGYLSFVVSMKGLLL